MPTDGHNVEDCPGSFRAMYNSVAALDECASALVCPECGATRQMAGFDGGGARNAEDDPEG